MYKFFFTLALGCFRVSTSTKEITMFEAIEFAGKVVDRSTLRFEGKEVVDGKFKDGTELSDKQLRLLSEMNAIADLV